MSIGEEIIDAIIKGRLIKSDVKVPTVLVWSVNAAEQLTALVEDRSDKGQTCSSA